MDFGLKRVGLAVCDVNRILATPLDAYKTKSMRDTIDHVADLAEQRGACGIVVGLPLNLDGSESEASGRVRAFARNLEKVSALPVALVDERLTTVEADELLRESGVKNKAERDRLIDSASATVILQSYLEKNQKRSVTMAEEQQNVDLIDDEFITLYDGEDDKPVKFREEAVVEYNGDFYALLCPVEPMEGVAEDEALIFKIVQEDEDTDVYEPVTDENLMNEVYNEYERYFEECGCGDCDCCGDECDCADDGCDCGCEHHHHE